MLFLIRVPHIVNNLGYAIHMQNKRVLLFWVIVFRFVEQTQEISQASLWYRQFMQFDNNMIPRSQYHKWKHAVPAEKTAKGERTTREVWSEKRQKKRERRQAYGQLSSAHGTVCAWSFTCTKIICGSGDSRRFLLSWRVGKCVAKRSWESKIAAIGVPVRNDGYVNFRVIWHSDCLRRLSSYCSVLLVRQVGRLIGLLMTLD